MITQPAHLEQNMGGCWSRKIQEHKQPREGAEDRDVSGHGEDEAHPSRGS